MHALADRANGHLLAAGFGNDHSVEPPGMSGVHTIISWILWGASGVLFVAFIVGIASAGWAHHRGDPASVSKPVVALVGAAILGASGTIWNAFAH